MQHTCHLEDLWNGWTAEVRASSEEIKGNENNSASIKK